MAVEEPQSLDWRSRLDDEEDDILKDNFRSAIEQPDASGVKEAAVALDKVARQQGPPHFAAGLVTYLPDIFVHAAALPPHDSVFQDNLVALLSTLLHLPDSDDGNYCPDWANLFGSDTEIQMVEAEYGMSPR